MQIFKQSMFHFLLITGNLLLCCLILILTRNFIELKFPIFEEIVLASIIATVITLGFTIYLTKLRSSKNSIRLLSYVNIIGLMLSLLVFPYALLNIDRSRSFYVLSWVDQGKVYVENGQIILEVSSTESTDIAGVGSRLKEQEQRGLIREANGVFKVTNTGKLMLLIANSLAKLFNLTNWEANKN